MTINTKQETNGSRALVAVEELPPLSELAEPPQEIGGQSSVAPGQTPEGDAVTEEKGRASNGEEDVAALKAEVAELKSALEAKASREETQALEATVGSLKDLFGKNGAKAEQEQEELEARTQQALTYLKERATALRTDLENLQRTLRAGRAQERVEPNAVPPAVLQQVYEEVLTEIFQEMTRLMGAGAPRITREIMEKVRKSSSGTEFFRLEDDKRIVAKGLTEAIRRRFLSPSQVHLTFNELSRQLSGQVPRYQARRFEDLVGTRTSAYTVTTIRRLVDQAGDLGAKLDGIAGQVDALEGLAARLDTLEANVKDATTSMSERIDGLEQRDQETVGRRGRAM